MRSEIGSPRAGNARPGRPGRTALISPAPTRRVCGDDDDGDDGAYIARGGDDGGGGEEGSDRQSTREASSLLSHCSGPAELRKNCDCLTRRSPWPGRVPQSTGRASPRPIANRTWYIGLRPSKRRLQNVATLHLRDSRARCELLISHRIRRSAWPLQSLSTDCM
jgi:hypothetical protein